MTARIVLLPDEDGAEFGHRLTGWFDSLKPRDEKEIYLTERTAYFAWQMRRIVRAESAMLSEKARNGPFEDRLRLERENAELTQRLFRAPFGRPMACPYSPGADSHGDGTLARQFETNDHPQMLVLKLAATLLGCRWLLAQWSQLKGILDDGLGWGASDRFRAYRLLGMHPSHTCIEYRTVKLFQALEVLDERAGSLVSEFWNEVVTVDQLPGLEVDYQRQIARLQAPDREAACQYLLEVVARETAELEAKLKKHEATAELLAELEPHLRAFDHSPEGELMRRYSATCDKLFFRHMDEVHRRRVEKQARGEPAHLGGYYLPSPDWFQGIGGSEANPTSDDWGDCSDSDDSPEEEDSHDTHATGEPPIEELPAPRRDERGVRNEPNGGGLRHESDISGLRSEANGDGLRNEANGAGGPGTIQIGKTEVVSAIEQILANQPRPAISVGQRRDRGHGNAVNASRRERKRRDRSRRNAERAAGRRDSNGKRDGGRKTEN
jgi:hypothetical protein